MKMEATNILCAVTEIQCLKAQYFRAMDTKDWPALTAVFTPDVIADFRYSTGHYDESLLFHGANEYVSRLAPVLTGVATVHHGHMPEIRIETPTSAFGVWAMEDKLWPDPASELPYRFMQGYGHYHERYARLASGWRIAEIRLTRLRVDIS